MIREDELLGRILDGLPGGAVGFPGPGDDAAGVRAPDGAWLLLTTDACEEGVHFERGLHPIRSVGRRAVAAAVSDVAAMGGSPAAILLSQVVPEGDGADAREIAASAGERAAELGARVVGGNLTRGARLAVHVTALGFMAAGIRPLTRSGARPGDGIWVSGSLGGSALGLRALRGGATGGRFVERHLDPEPRLRLGRELAGAASAAMDLSDGLALDLGRLAGASGVGAVVEASRIPADGDLEAALGGGEDYELLFTSADPAVAEAAARRAGQPVARIGRITPEPGLRLVTADGEEPLEARGWDALG